MKNLEAAPVVDGPEEDSSPNERQIGHHSVAQVIEDPRDFYVSWGFTD